MTWNYRITRQPLDMEGIPEELWPDDLYYYSLREAYYNEAGEVVGLTASIVVADSVEEIETVLRMMLHDVRKHRLDVLEYDKMKYGDWDHVHEEEE